MYNNQNHTIRFTALIIAALVCFSSCKDNGTGTAPGTVTSSAMKAHMKNSGQVTYLVADTAEYPGVRIDANLVNAWGITSREGDIWIGANGTGIGNNYDGNGQQDHAGITIPSRTASSGGVPTGAITNHTDDFVIPSGGVSKIIYGGEDGIISAWSGGSSAVRVAVSASSSGVYKGIAMGRTGDKNYLYATDFHNGKIDVYDKNFAPVTGMAFTDPGIPAGFAPFGIANIDGKLFVTYAMQKPPANHDDQAGPGNGYVDIYNPDGTLVKRFASQGTLNSPWGIAEDEGGRGEMILIGNFGDGTIGMYDMNGNFLGQLKDMNGNEVAVDGLWGIMFKNSDEEMRGGDHNRLYFAAGPNGEAHGAFGYIQLR